MTCSPVRLRSRFQRAPRENGFTLIELVISSALMAMVLVSTYACLNAGFSGQKVIEPRTDIFQNARVALNLLSADLRCACPLPQGAPFLGVRRLLGTVSADNLDFATHNYTPQRPGEGDFCEESIFLEKDPKSGRYTLWRRRNPLIAFDPLSGGTREELATGLAGLRLEYYDGLEWYDSWGDPKPDSTKSQLRAEKPNSSGLPEAVRITLLFDSGSATGTTGGRESTSKEPPLVFQTLARLTLPTSGTPGSAAPEPNSPATRSGPGN